MKNAYIIGWDIGGAHLKAALMDNTGVIIQTTQQACPLWQGIHRLEESVQVIMRYFDLDSNQISHAITMTGELVDCFMNRYEGVAQILNSMSLLFANNELFVFAGLQGLLPLSQIKIQHYEQIASTNWLASATVTAQLIGDGLFVDIGSTTTDILVLKNNQVLAQGMTDYQRLCTQELIYTGIIRTPVMAITQSIPYETHSNNIDNHEGLSVGIMAEYFATMADVYRLTGELNEAHDQSNTADGAEKTIIASARRLSRMIGCDFFESELSRWQRVAQYLRNQQLNKIELACSQHLLNASHNSPLIGAGVGRFLVKQLAQHLQRPYIDFSDLFEQNPIACSLQTADCAPAVAMAYLANR
ncbi:MAG: hydantoinase/oxoprolinase family protein [Methylococcaceae bacterium]